MQFALYFPFDADRKACGGQKSLVHLIWRRGREPSLRDALLFCEATVSIPRDRHGHAHVPHPHMG